MPTLHHQLPIAYIYKLTLNIQEQVLPSLFSSYPSLQMHTKLPGVLIQVWSQGEDVHSSISVFMIQA